MPPIGKPKVGDRVVLRDGRHGIIVTLPSADRAGNAPNLTAFLADEDVAKGPPGDLLVTIDEADVIPEA